MEWQQVIEFRNALSWSGFLTTGVPQGSIIGPLSSLLNVNDLPPAIDKEAIMFAVDLLLSYQ